jgi:hypothetical protein
MKTSWHFIAVRADTPSGFMWHWQKEGAKTPVTSAPFAFYFDCVSDARDKGYIGPLPAGPRAPIEHLPGGAAAGRSTRSEPGSIVMTVTGVSAVDARRRRASGRSRVA